jgi:hypothetical protein
MLRRSLSFICFLVILAACAPISATSLQIPTGTSPSIITLTPPEISSPTPLNVTPTEIPPTLTVQISSPTLEESSEPTLEDAIQPTPTLIPQTTAASTAVPQPSSDASAIQLYSPGPQSKIVSPLVVYGYAVPGYHNKGRIDLFGEDGRLLASEILQLNTAYKWAYFYWPLPFKISSAGELARLSLSTQDQYGRVTAVNSVHVLLLPEGESIVNPPGDLSERCMLDRPIAGKQYSGGMLEISGKMLPYNDLPIKVELITRDGSVTNSQLIPIARFGTDFVAFRVDISYSLLRGEWELLTVSQYDDRIGGLMYLYSQEIYLNP